MVTATLHGKKKYVISIPEKWAEVTPKLFAYIFRQQLLNIDTEKIKIGVLWQLAKGTCPKRQFWDMAESQAAILLEVLNWIEEPPVCEESLFPSIRVYDWFSYARRSLLYRLKPPGKNLSGISINQVAIAEIALNAYTATQQVQYLNLLVAALYYPKAVKAGIDDKTLDVVEHRVAKLNFTTRFTALVAYRAIRATFTKSWPNLFSGKSGKAAPADDVKLWKNLFVGLGTTGPKDIEAQRRTEAFDVLDWLDKNAEDLAKIKARK